MITSKQRATLRAKANSINPIFQIGKSGLSENLLNDISDALESRELIKLTVLKNSEIGAKELVNIIAEKLNAEPVSAIGNKITIYRRSNKENMEHIEI